MLTVRCPSCAGALGRYKDVYRDGPFPCGHCGARLRFERSKNSLNLIIIAVGLAYYAAVIVLRVGVSWTGRGFAFGLLAALGFGVAEYFAIKFAARVRLDPPAAGS